MFGLTVAEVFILLLFLLMLLFLSLSQQWEANAENLQKVRQNLREVSAERGQLKQESEVLRDRIRTLSRQHESVKQQRKRVEQALTDARRLLDGQDETLLEEVQKQRERAEQLESELGEKVALLEKGENPPCWYRKVPDSDKASGEREKAYYSFDVGVFEDHLIVRRGDTPPGGAEDDNGGSFADEANALNFDALPYGQRLSDGEFERHFEPIWQAGKKSRVRSYSCIFWVRVWDETAPGAKVRWKQAHDKVLEGLFGTYQVQDDPWLPIAP